MKISVLSDLHLGFASRTEREEDAYEAAIEAFEKASDSDIILLGGDVFDTKVPSNETLVRAMELLLMNPLSGDSSAKLFEGTGKELSEVSPRALSGIPVVAIHGTHERRAAGLLNPVQLLEKAGFIVYLDRNGVIFQKGNEKVCVQGLSGVLDKHTEEALSEWNPKPTPGCLNIFMIHQNLTDFMHERVLHTLDTAKLPKGFDFYICGHIHEPTKGKHESGVILLPGSLIPTQLTRDPGNENGFWQIDSETKEARFIRLENQRRVYFREFDAGTSTGTGIIDAEAIEREIKGILKEKHRKKPLIRIKLSGRHAELPLKHIQTKYEDRAIISFKKDFERDAIPKARGMEEHKLSVQELGRKIMRDNLKELKLDERIFESIFELLLEKKTDEALRLLRIPANSLTKRMEPTKEKEAELPKPKKKTKLKKEPKPKPEPPTKEPEEEKEPEPEKKFKTKPAPKPDPDSWKQFLRGA